VRHELGLPPPGHGCGPSPHALAGVRGKGSSSCRTSTRRKTDTMIGRGGLATVSPHRRETAHQSTRQRPSLPGVRDRGVGGRLLRRLPAPEVNRLGTGLWSTGNACLQLLAGLRSAVKLVPAEPRPRPPGTYEHFTIGSPVERRRQESPRVRLVTWTTSTPEGA